MEKNEIAESIDHGVGQFAAEASAAVDDVSRLFVVKDYPEEMHELIIECNRRIDEANSKYRIAKFREDMFAKGMKAGMYFCTFDRDENMLSFEFNEETRQMLGYDGLEDLPNEFDSCPGRARRNRKTVLGFGPNTPGSAGYHSCHISYAEEGRQPHLGYGSRKIYQTSR